MVRDLRFPEDAHKVIDGLHGGLRYDAALAVMGNACRSLPFSTDGTPDFSTALRASGHAEDQAVRREAPGLLSRFALISMVSRIDVAAQRLLLQRRVLEKCASTRQRIPPGGMWPNLRKVYREYRGGPVKLCSELVVTNPSPELARRMRWLGGLVDVRNCLTHRLGVVDMEDVKPAGASIEQVQDTDRLRAVWLRPVLLLGGKEIALPYLHEGGEALKVRFDEYDREWKIGDHIHIQPVDCQAISISLSMLGNQLLDDFIREMNAFLRSSTTLNPPYASGTTEI